MSKGKFQDQSGFYLKSWFLFLRFAFSESFCVAKQLKDLSIDCDMQEVGWVMGTSPLFRLTNNTYTRQVVQCARKQQHFYFMKFEIWLECINWNYLSDNNSSLFLYRTNQIIVYYFLLYKVLCLSLYLLLFLLLSLCVFLQSFIHSFVHSFIHSFIRSFIHSLIHFFSWDQNSEKIPNLVVHQSQAVAMLKDDIEKRSLFFFSMLKPKWSISYGYMSWFLFFPISTFSCGQNSEKSSSF